MLNFSKYKKSNTVKSLIVDASTILFFYIFTSKLQARQCQKLRLLFEGAFYSRAPTIWDFTVYQFSIEFNENPHLKKKSNTDFLLVEKWKFIWVYFYHGMYETFNIQKYLKHNMRNGYKNGLFNKVPWRIRESPRPPLWGLRPFFFSLKSFS